MTDLFDQLLVSCPNGGGVFLLHKGTAHKLDSLDTTGLDVRGARIARAIQPASLVLFHVATQELAGEKARIDDLHDAYIEDDACYVASTRGNEIVKLDYDGKELRRWTFPGEIDAWHINCITRWNGRIVFSAFTDRTQHRAYKKPPFETGFVQDLETGERPIVGLFQPHSLVPDRERLLLANSGTFEIQEYDAGGKLLRKRVLDGYTRGVLRHGQVLYVGLSKSRNAETEVVPRASVVALDADTWEELGRIRLQVDEVYSLTSLTDGVDIVGVMARLASHASARSAGELAKAKGELAFAERGREQLASRLDALTRGSIDSERRIHGLLETVQGKDVQIQNRDQIIRDKDAEIGRRDQLLQESEARIREREQGMRELLDRLSGLVVAVATADAQVREWVDAAKRKDEQIHALTELLRTAQSRLAELEQEQTAGHGQLIAQIREVAARDRIIAAMQTTISWRITRPLRGVRRLGSAVMHPINKLHHVCRTLYATLRDPEQRERYLTLGRVLGPRAAMHHTVAYLRRGGPRPRPPIPVPVFDLRPGLGRRTVILTTPHCEFVAHSIRRALQKIGVQSSIIHARPDAGYEALPHFVICPQMFERLPDLYVAFQMEQSVSTRWFTDAYLRVLENSFAILDYSVANIDALVARGLHRMQLFYLPLGYLPDYSARSDKAGEEYDVVFYGDINNDRRRRFVAALEKVCRVKVFNDLFGDALRAELAKAKLVVNIHYYEGALLETTRLWECISLGKLVVSERAVNMDENGDLEKLVDFVDLNDVDGLVERVQYWLGNEHARQARIESNCKLAAQQPNRFEYFFYRFLLAWDIISFYRFWELAGSKLTLGGDKLCLNLPEWTRRRHSFDQDNHYGFQVFPGLRHREGWIGCALSYKLMIMLARKQRMPQITICEDDVEFHEGFSEDFARIQAELAKPHEHWDVFSGLLGDLHADAKILRVRDMRDRKFVQTNRLISTVFNIYHRGVFDRVSLWDDRDRDVVNNTIDRYLEHTHLSVLACYPFLVGHKEDLHSTLWGVQNGEMVAMIQRSERLLGRKIEEFVAHAQQEV